LLASIAWEASAQAPRALRHWFERLFRLFPNLRFEMHSIAASGWPWDTTVVVEWTDRATPADGKDYVNSGVHVIRMRWGKVVSIHAYLDTQVLIDTLNRMAVNGIEEAKAPPIIGS
jgi:ketosteroid isomerase-like protein